MTGPPRKVPGLSTLPLVPPHPAPGSPALPEPRLVLNMFPLWPPNSPFLTPSVCHPRSLHFPLTYSQVSYKVNSVCSPGVRAVAVPSAFNVCLGFSFGGGVPAQGSSSAKGKYMVSYSVSKWDIAFARLGSLSPLLRSRLSNPVQPAPRQPLTRVTPPHARPTATGCGGEPVPHSRPAPRSAHQHACDRAPASVVLRSVQPAVPHIAFLPPLQPGLPSLASRVAAGPSSSLSFSLGYLARRFSAAAHTLPSGFPPTCMARRGTFLPVYTVEYVVAFRVLWGRDPLFAGLPLASPATMRLSPSSPSQMKLLHTGTYILW
jgi:hypothetical protein